MTIEVVEAFRSELTEIELRSEQSERPTQYDDVGSLPIKSVLLRQAGKSAAAFNVHELLEAIRAIGLDLKTFAKSAPEDLAKAVGHLEDDGRVICNHALFADLIREQRRLLPCVEDTCLVWNTITFEHGDPIVQQHRLRLT